MRTLVLSLLVLVLLPTVRATHVMGSDLGYRHVGGSSYLVTLTVFRDCGGIQLAPWQVLELTSSSCSIAYQDTLLFHASTQIGPDCSGMSSTCQGGAFPGLELAVFQDTIDLPAACADWELTWSQCCRNASIMNLQDPGIHGARNRAMLDNLNAPSNTSPVFQELTMPYVAMVGGHCLANGAYDAEGDSLVFTRIAPLDQTGSPIAYAPGHTTADPFPTVNGHVFDPVTGNHCAEPLLAGVWALAYRVDEYRNGQLVGSVMRDLQLAVLNTPAATFGFTGTVSDTTGLPVSAGEVQLHAYGLNAAAGLLFASQQVNGSGQYTFTNVPQGQYILRAIPDTLLYPGAAPTYWMNTYYWTYAEVQSGLCDSTFVCDIQLVSTADLVGSGVVGGYLGDLGIVRSSGGGFGDPWAGANIVLERWPLRELVAATRTDAGGNFQFEDVPHGTYRVLVDHPGLPMLGHYRFDVDATHLQHLGLDHAATPAGVLPYMAPTGMEALPDVGASVYPNPVENGQLMLDGIPDGLLLAQLIDASGRIAASWSLVVNEGRARLDLAGVKAGAYVLRLDGRNSLRVQVAP